jgi:glycosyltransferase involved in cell wall biosynthesis
MTVTEARLGARFGGPIVVVSDTGGMTPQVIDGVDGFHVKTGDSADMARVFRKVLGMSDAKMAAFRKTALDNMLRQYTWPLTILQTWAAVCPAVADVADEVADVVRVRPEQLAG